MTKPIVSAMASLCSNIDIICSVKNGGIKFAATIDSVLTQTFYNFHFIIVDDGSDDEVTRCIAENALAKDIRVSVYRNEFSQGLTANLVNHVQQSSANFIARIDAGDMWLPEKLEKQVRFMQNNEDVIVLGTQCIFMSPEGIRLGKSRFGEDDQAIREAIFIGNGVLSHSSIMFRKKINYRREFRYSQDLDLYLRASEIGQLHCLNEPLIFCLIDPDGLTLKRKYQQRKYIVLAYKSYYARVGCGKEVDLKVSESNLERAWWMKVMHLYHRYIDSRIKEKSPIVWGFYLAITLILFPPMLGDYLKRLLRLVVININKELKMKSRIDNG